MAVTLFFFYSGVHQDTEKLSVLAKVTKLVSNGARISIKALCYIIHTLKWDVLPKKRKTEWDHTKKAIVNGLGREAFFEEVISEQKFEYRKKMRKACCPGNQALLTELCVPQILMLKP